MFTRNALCACLVAALPTQIVIAEAGVPLPEPRQIEEIVVTAERKQSTVSDTSISITAFTGEMIEAFGLHNQEDLQKFIPATIIEPYDISIRGIGRTYRALGGDPGVATYQNGIYSEDFGIASTEGGLFDIDRIEVLRGPQGTLYGRNAIGGAINFINKRPTHEFEGEASITGGNYRLREQYGMLSGPIIDEVLSARAVGTKRTRDGYIDDKSGNQNPDNYGDENYALALQWTPADNIVVNTRGNERSSRRRMGGADAGGIVTLTENAGVRDPVTGNPRNTSTFAMGYRPVDDTVCQTLATGRTNEVVGGVRVPGCRITTATTGYQNQPGSTVVYTFTDPISGSPVEAQRVTPGVDFTEFGNNAAFGTALSRQRMLGLGSLKGADASTDTSGHQDEYFDHQSNSTDIQWSPNDRLSIKYIFGYTDYFYDRTTDTDLTSNTDADTIYSGDSQFYLSQQATYVSHELQFFNDFTDKLSTTSGLFYYSASITQRGDTFDSNGNGIYAQNFDYSAAGPYDFIAFFPKVGLFTAKQAGIALRNGVSSGLDPTTESGCSQVPFNGDPFEFCFGQWAADTGGRVPHGPTTAATSSEYQTRSEREAFAAYSQSVYSFNDRLALTLGLRWARDQLDGEENSFAYTEGVVELGGNLDTASLTAMNIATGALATDGAVLDYNQLRTQGVPISQSLWRQLHRKDDAVTWRVNFDWTPNDNNLIYLSATSGYRAGGFALGFVSFEARSHPENLIAYELGYKGEMLEDTFQLNAAAYYYDYKHAQIFAATASALGGTSSGAFSVPTAEVFGFDADALWLVSQRTTMGATFSYTHSEYTSNFYIIDTTNARRPESLFDPTTTPFNINGNDMLHVPELKAEGYAQYQLPLGEYGAVTLLADYSWISKVYFSEFVLSSDKAPDYGRLDLRATWQSASGNWAVASFVDNVLNDIGIRQIEANGEGANFRRDGTLTDPRVYGIEVRYKFGAFN